MNNQTILSAKEQKTYKSLIRLGDSKELALKTVLADRSKKVDYGFYRNAYCS